MKITTLSFLIVSTSAFAQTNWGAITLVNSAGVAITNARVLKVDSGKLTYVSDNGGGTVAIADLPPDLQKRFGNTPPSGNDNTSLIPPPKLSEEDLRDFNDTLAKAQSGDVQAQGHLGHDYASGVGTPVNFAEAFKWDKKSAEQGNAEGENGLGWCYLFGYGVEQNADEALKWLHKSADQGFRRAEFNLGYSCENGLGATTNLAEAAKWYQKSAEHGYQPAQTTLGTFYEDGKGVGRNLKEACKWFEIASTNRQGANEQDNKLAMDMLSTTKAEMELEVLMPDTNSVSPLPPTETPAVQTRPDLEILDLRTKVVESTDYYRIWSYQLKVRNNTLLPISGIHYVEFIDADGFIIDKGPCMVRLAAGETKTFLDTHMIRLPGASQVKNVKAE